MRCEEDWQANLKALFALLLLLLLPHFLVLVVVVVSAISCTEPDGCLATPGEWVIDRGRGDGK